MERAAPVSLILFGLTVTFASFDWLMSLEPTWFSTIFGLYYFAGSVVGFLAILILFAIVLQQGGMVRHSITIEHYHDLGKLLLGFVVFWGYMAFSQYIAHLVREYPRGKRLVSCPADRSLEVGHHRAAFWKFADSFPVPASTRGQAT